MQVGLAPPKSVADLAAANAAYIGFVHTVLQISHTFTRQYLHEAQPVTSTR
jgi:hypothetical protein